MTVQGLAEAARRGERGALDTLVRAVWPDAYRLAYGILAERHAAEDAAQEACIALTRRLGSLRSADAFRTWFARIVVREASAAKKRRSRSVAADTLDVTGAAAPDFADSAASVDLWRGLASLPSALRTIVVLRYFEDLSSREIGAVLGIPAPTVRFRLMRALHRLRPLLADPREPAHAVNRSAEPQSHAC